MVRAKRSSQNFGSLFEDDYLLRTLGRIAHEPEVALTELVANAWDAGAWFSRNRRVLVRSADEV